MLVVAAGATPSYFGREDWESFSPGLKTHADAAHIRRRIYLAVESAEREPNVELRKALLTFVVVAGGSIGFELGDAIWESARHKLKDDSRHITPEDSQRNPRTPTHPTRLETHEHHSRPNNLSQAGAKEGH